jgi:hypothetical protein
MTLNKLRINAVNRATTKAVSRIESVTAKRDVYDILDEVGAWLLFAGVSLTGWLVAAIAFGVV